MALQLSILEGAFAIHVAHPTGDPGIAAARLATAYAAYAATAQSCSGLGPVTASITAAKTILEQRLHASFAQVGRDGRSDVVAAFRDFWLSPPIAFLGAPPGAVTTVNAAVLGRINLSKLPVAVVPRMLAKAYETFTKTVVVTHGAPLTCTSTIT